MREYPEIFHEFERYKLSIQSRSKSTVEEYLLDLDQFFRFLICYRSHGNKDNFSLEEFEAMGLEMTDLTRDLHNSPLNEGNIMTEYERAWSEKGYPIHAVTVKF